MELSKLIQFIPEIHDLWPHIRPKSDNCHSYSWLTPSEYYFFHLHVIKDNKYHDWYSNWRKFSSYCHMNKSPVPDNQVRLRYILNTTQLLNQLTKLEPIWHFGFVLREWFYWLSKCVHVRLGLRWTWTIWFRPLTNIIFPLLD